MVLWFGKKNKPDASVAAPETPAPVDAAKEAERLEIERAVAEANRAWEARMAREAAEADDEAARAKAIAELKILEDRREGERLRAEYQARLDAEANAPGFIEVLGQGLARSAEKLSAGLVTFGKRRLDADTLIELEDLLIASDMGTRVAKRVTKEISRERFDREISEEEIRLALAAEIEAILRPRERVVDFSDGPSPRIVLFVGVNGSGKTTTIGKIASQLKDQGAKTLLVAGDTFRAAAIEQLTVWGNRAGIAVLAKNPGADAAGLAYEAVEKAKAEGLDLVLMDTAGRLQNKTELMDELSKIVRVMRKVDPTAPHDVILVLDATVGQNALSQVDVFKQIAGVTGLVMTKLDGTAKGGVLVAIAEAHDLPIHFIGIGERAEDLRPFSASAFAKALVGVS